MSLPKKTRRARRSGASSQPTVVDVARAAGVSPQTVSNALNQPERVTEKTLEKVRRAIAQVSYRPSYAAQALRGGVSRTVAVVTLGDDEAHHFDRPYFGRVLNGILRTIEPRGYKALIHQARPGELDGLLELFEQGRVDGAVVLAGVAPARDLKRLQESGRPVVLIDRRSTKLPCAHADYASGIADAVTHAANGGAKRFLYLSGRVGKEKTSTPFLRLKGFEQTVKSLGLVRRSQVVACGWNAQAGRSALLEAVADGKKYDTILCASDDIAFGALSALRQQGQSVPDQVRVIGFDASTLSEMCDPQLSSVAVPFERLAEEATERLLQTLKNGSSSLPREYRAAPELIVRGT